MIISVDSEKSILKIQYAFMIKAFSKPGISEHLFNLIKAKLIGQYTYW